ncbi:MAG: flagellar motor protein [Acidimicrobiia bacterium]|nr:flagellar motor protein [Acidimicrobiia bacterium]
MAKAKGPKKKPDFATLGGLALALLGIVGGLLLEGGEMKDISQYTAAVIVLGGTLGAVLINTPMGIVKGAMKYMGQVFFERADGSGGVADELIEYATKARKNGVVSLENDANGVQDPFMKKALILAVDGTDLQEIRKMLELEIAMEEQYAEQCAKVFESAGGYAPTIGIIGAVMGLIQVMKNLSDIDKVGHGIAVAFVATVYGVAIANILFLPMANKIKARAAQEAQLKELILEGITGIVEGMNPKLIRAKLSAYLPPTTRGKGAPVQAEA